jgi:hypothetical protein
MEKLHKDSKFAKITEVVSSKPELGKKLGNFKLTFRYYDGTAIEFKGKLSDVSGLFCNKSIQKDFKRVILEEIGCMDLLEINPISPKLSSTVLNDGEVSVTKQVEVSSTLDKDSVEKKPALQIAAETFAKFDFSTACRVLLLEEGVSHQLHLIVQIGRLKIITEYADNIDASQWSLVKGLEFDYLADGTASTFPHRQRLRDLGEVFIHVFIPEDHRWNSEVSIDALDKAKPLTEIISRIPQTVDIEQYLKSKEDQLKSKESALEMARGDLSEKATRNDAAGVAVAGHEEFDSNKGFHIRFDFTDALLVALPTLAGAIIGWSLNPLGWLAGFAIFYPIGCYLVSRRK